MMNHLLEEIFEEERAAGRPALTSIVIHKDGDKEPDPGFYEEARTLGYQFEERPTLCLLVDTGPGRVQAPRPA